MWPSRHGLAAADEVEAPWRRRTPQQAGAVVAVLVDDGSFGLHAVEWAAAEAAGRGALLRVLHTFAWPRQLDPPGSTASDTAGFDDAAWAVVDAASARARAVAPGIHVSTDVRIGTDPVLRGDEELIVVGLRGRRGSRRAFDRDGAGGPSAGRVVVGIDGRLEPLGLLGFGYRAARRRGVGLTVVELGEESSSADFLQLAGTLFPAVDVRHRWVPRPTGSVLLEEAAGAALVVLGSRGHRRQLRRFMSRCLTRGVIRLSNGPLVVVPTSDRCSWHEAWRALPTNGRSA